MGRLVTKRLGPATRSLGTVESSLGAGGRSATAGRSPDAAARSLSPAPPRARSRPLAMSVAVVVSGGWTSRRRPSRSALRRTRSACWSSMLEEWLLTPMPRSMHRSSASLFCRPSSRASSYTRIFLAKLLRQSLLRSKRATDAAPSILARSWSIARSASTASAPTVARNARLNAWRRPAHSIHLSAGSPVDPAAHSQAPRPGAERSMASVPSGRRATRTSPETGVRSRQPTHDRTGTATAPPRRATPAKDHARQLA